MAATAPVSGRFAPNPRRRSLIAKVKVAQKQLGLVEDVYRAMLFRVAGKYSAGDCSEAELVAVVEEMKAKGFSALPKMGPTKAPAKPRPADNPMAKKARALWISLYQLAVVDNPAEQALEAFAQRQLGVAKMQWADQSKAYKLIEALKAMATRAGWDQDLSAVPAGSHVHVLRVRLCQTILAKLQKLGFAPRNWSLADAAWHMCGVHHASDETLFDTTRLDVIAAGLGAKLRTATGKREDRS